MQPTLIPKSEVRALRLRSLSTSLVFTIAAVATVGIGLAAPSTETVIYNFVGANGGYPDGSLVLGADSGLYGTTVSGGAFNQGTIFELIPPATSGGAWTEKVLYSFTGGLDGGQPATALVFDSTGALYGTAENAAGSPTGVAFKLSPPDTVGGSWYETTIYTFGVGKDGADPNSGLVFDKTGDLFGTTTAGGTAGLGTVFKLYPPSSGSGVYTEQVLYNFTGGSDGANPYANVAFDSKGVMYGTTTAGGINNSGTVYMMASSSNGPVFTTLYEFTGGADGGVPYSPVVIGPKGAIFGTTFFGGTSASGIGSYGTVFQIAPPSKVSASYVETVLHTFNGADGANPSSGLVTDGAGGFYGTTAGGVTGYGNVFDLTPPTTSGGSWSETVLYSFVGTGGDGQAPLGKVLVTPGGVLYGTTYYGGAFGPGSAFQLK